jgi:hypothetical protein
VNFLREKAGKDRCDAETRAHHHPPVRLSKRDRKAALVNVKFDRKVALINVNGDRRAARINLDNRLCFSLWLRE